LFIIFIVTSFEIDKSNSEGSSVRRLLYYSALSAQNKANYTATGTASKEVRVSLKSPTMEKSVRMSTRQ